MASRRSPISTTCAAARPRPATIAARIAAGSSSRGLSSVTTTRSASSAATAAHRFALARVAVAARAEHHGDAGRSLCWRSVSSTARSAPGLWA